MIRERKRKRRGEEAGREQTGEVWEVKESLNTNGRKRQEVD